MRKLIIAAGLFVLLPVALMAQETSQETPQAEVYTGFSYLRLEKTNQIGWNASVDGNLNRNLGIVSDVSGYYRSDSNTFTGITRQINGSIHSFMVGPRVSDPRGRFNPFAQALFGWSRVHTNVDASAGSTALLSTSASTNAFGVALGGGLDYNLNPMTSVRVLQIDYMMLHANSDKLQGVRVGGGVVFLMGRKK